jgi:predicted nucleic acid-binding protein
VILADTSAWVEYDRATGSSADERLCELIETAGALAVTEPVVMEVLAGARDQHQEDRLRRLLSSFELLQFDSAVDFDAAALIYRRCRVASVTPRGLLDCSIAAVAWRHQAALLAHDVDLDRVASVIGIAVDEGSLRA